jgi:Anti-sigma-K factor rskA/Putative zinc-finger
VSQTNQNDSSEGAWTVLSDPHDEFRGLCALSTTGELTTAECVRLDEHLSHCKECRELKQPYERLVVHAIPALAENLATDPGQDTSFLNWSIEKAEERLMSSLGEKSAPPIDDKGRPAQPAKWKPVYHSIAAAAVLIGIGGVGYGVGSHHGRSQQSAVIARAPHGTEASVPFNKAVTEMAPTGTKKESDDERVAELSSQIRRDQSEITKLQEEQSQLRRELSAQATELDRGSQLRTELDHRLLQAQSDSLNLQEKLRQTTELQARNTIQPPTLRADATDQTALLREKDAQIAQQQELLQRDRDIRNLIGARDLYIAEIYDVAKTGDTQKPFGRVFYTRDKSLVFYGYDLDQQHGFKNASTFQAWGRRDSDQQHDVSLGIFYQDESNMKRWVLKSSDAATLAQLDAVFVTVEPPGGSAKPTGKPLLFTYLRLNPNHP